MDYFCPLLEKYIKKRSNQTIQKANSCTQDYILTPANPAEDINMLTDFEEINFFHKLEVFKKKTYKQ